MRSNCTHGSRAQTAHLPLWRIRVYCTNQVLCASVLSVGLWRVGQHTRPLALQQNLYHLLIPFTAEPADCIRFVVVLMFMSSKVGCQAAVTCLLFAPSGTSAQEIRVDLVNIHSHLFHCAWVNPNSEHQLQPYPDSHGLGLCTLF